MKGNWKENEEHERKLKGKLPRGALQLFCSWLKFWKKKKKQKIKFQFFSASLRGGGGGGSSGTQSIQKKSNQILILISI